MRHAPRCGVGYTEASRSFCKLLLCRHAYAVSVTVHALGTVIPVVQTSFVGGDAQVCSAASLCLRQPDMSHRDEWHNMATNAGSVHMDAAAVM